MGPSGKEKKSPSHFAETNQQVKYNFIPLLIQTEVEETKSSEWKKKFSYVPNVDVAKKVSRIQESSMSKI
jgi:hypothetical protein